MHCILIIIHILFTLACQNQESLAPPCPRKSPDIKMVSCRKRESSCSTICSVSEGSLCSDSPPRNRLSKIAMSDKDEGEYTTIMIRNIPCRYTQEWLIEEVGETNANFDFLYLPPSKRVGCLGYAFCNFATPADAQMFIKAFQDHKFNHQPNSQKRAEVVFAVLQGFEENLKFYKKSKVGKTKNCPYINRG